jgi:hypothetical protein
MIRYRHALDLLRLGLFQAASDLKGAAKLMQYVQEQKAAFHALFASKRKQEAQSNQTQLAKVVQWEQNAHAHGWSSLGATIRSHYGNRRVCNRIPCLDSLILQLFISTRFYAIRDCNNPRCHSTTHAYNHVQQMHGPAACDNGMRLHVGFLLLTLSL